jgi:hypothetical protein
MIEFIALFLLVVLTGIQQVQIQKLKSTLLSTAKLVGSIVELNGNMVGRINELTILVTKKPRKTVVKDGATVVGVPAKILKRRAGDRRKEERR